MRVAAWALVSGIVMVAAVPAQAAPPQRAKPAVACPSLANLRLMTGRHRDDREAMAATLADAKADHLGCILLERDRAIAVTERLAFGPNDYECLAIQGTSVCHWISAGAIVPAPPSGAVTATGPRKPGR